MVSGHSKVRRGRAPPAQKTPSKTGCPFTNNHPDESREPEGYGTKYREESQSFLHLLFYDKEKS
jgi:hypothetical protein